MKKYIIVLMFVALMPVAQIHAQTTAELQAQYQQSLIQLIALLEQKIQILRDEIRSQQDAEQSTGATHEDTTTEPSGGTIENMDQTFPDLFCSLTIGDEGVSTVQAADGTRTSVPSGRFQMNWSYTPGAVATLVSDNENVSPGTLAQSVGSSYVRLNQTTHYTLTVSKYGYNNAVCTAAANKN